MACIKRPCVSTRICRFLAFDLLAASKPCGSMQRPFSRRLRLLGCQGSRRSGWRLGRLLAALHIKRFVKADQRHHSSRDRNNHRASSAAANPRNRSPLAAVLKIYIKPLTTSRSSTWRRLPPRLAGGISGATSAIRHLSGRLDTAICCGHSAHDFTRPHRRPPSNQEPPVENHEQSYQSIVPGQI